jgi:hypothetical protein
MIKNGEWFGQRDKNSLTWKVRLSWGWLHLLTMIPGSQASGEQASVVIKFAQINVNYWSSNNVKPWLPGLLLMVYDVNING